MSVTGSGNYFEDFRVGDTYEHQRGRTVEQFDNYLLTHLSMNTAQAHFNLPYSQALLDGNFRERLVPGPCTLGIVIGLTSEDMSENSFADLGLTAVKMPHPVFAGDTLHAASEVLELKAESERPGAGFMRYRFVGTNQDKKVVVEGERLLLLKKKSHFNREKRA
ncbi:MAG: MaoC family dehydratase [Rhizomicrobium sp.]